MKSGGFHGEIWWISWWNLVDFMKSSGFHAKDFGSDEKYSIQWSNTVDLYWFWRKIHYS